VHAVVQTMTSSAGAWARALSNIAPLQRQGNMTLPLLIDDLADRFETKPALRSPAACLSYRDLAQRKNQYARWGIERRASQAAPICLLMHNCPEYLAIWLGIAQIGGVVALINTNLRGDALLHAIRVVSPTHLIADVEFSQALCTVLADLPNCHVWWHRGEGCDDGGARRWLNRSQYADGTLAAWEQPEVTASQTALYIYTSGTTGMPKAAKLSHYRAMEWAYWFAGMMNTAPNDCLYNCLPMYHSTGGVAVIGAVLVNGGTVVLRRRFSARLFWDDVLENDCSLFLYIGELCNHLVGTAPVASEKRHRLRLCCGNGLRADIWEAFVNRFGIPHVLEFYASTEGNVALYNCDGRPGAIGRVPSFLAHRFPVRLIACDPNTGEARRGPDGRCICCAPGEVGEAIGKIIAADDAGPRQFEGYTDPDATARKVLRGAFSDGDAWFRTGDLMRQDKAGFFYFVDRMGETYRWKGENVSTVEVADALRRCPGVTGAVVYGVAVPGAEGRVGMAAITTGPSFNLGQLHNTLVAHLPPYARPMFLRLVTDLETTGTFKPMKAKLAYEGYASADITDALYINDTATGTFKRLDAERALQPGGNLRMASNAGHGASGA